MVLIGEQELIYDPQLALDRASRTIPRLDAVLVPNAGHLLNMEQADRVDARLLEFINAET